MELVTVLRLLWRRRVLVGLGVVAAICVGFMVGNGTPRLVGVASTRVVVDTPRSQAVEPSPRGASTLAQRTALLADLASTDSVRRRIASGARVPADQLLVVDDRLTTPAVLTALPEAAARAAAADHRRYELTLHADETLPIITIDARTPDRRSAVRLAAVAANTLKVVAAPGDAPATRGSVVNVFSPISAREVVQGPRRLFALIAFVVTLVLWCTCIAVAPGIARAGRRAVEGRAPGLT
jgi:hypothetical protein